MKQILHSLSDGKIYVEDVPCPKNTMGSILISSKHTLLSTGTERMLLEFGKSGYISKALKQPEKVKEVLSKIKSDGLASTIEAVQSKLDNPMSLGYCNVGIVMESSVDKFNAGDRVASNGNHAEVVRVKENLCARIPDEVDDESAAFTVIGAIGLQGIRLLKPTLGESIVVIGLGLIGLMCVQMLRANGCRVLAIDIDSEKCKLAKEFGAEVIDTSTGENALKKAEKFSRGRGVDGVLITASTRSNEIIHNSASMCRKKGRIVLVGVIGLDLKRDDFYKKELTFQVSCSYGPGRYDSLYEEKGQDYPVAYVRWTEQRNFEAVLDMMAAGMINVKPLVSHRFSLEKAIEAYSVLDESSTLGVIFNYTKTDKSNLSKRCICLSQNAESSSNIEGNLPYIGVIGAGNYASRILIPYFKSNGAHLHTLVTSGGVSGVYHGKKNDFTRTSTDIEDIYLNDELNTVVIVTPHNQHAAQVIKAFESGKNVFVEKPLALTLDELDEIESAYNKGSELKNNLKFMVGFNRRFAPHIIKIKSLLETHRSPKSVIISVNSGAIAVDHWVQDKNIGGGRIIGEACHFIDLMRFLIGQKITSFQVSKMNGSINNDVATITLIFADGSFGTIHYFSNGGKVFPKERIDVFCDDAVLQLENYKMLKGYGWSGFSGSRSFKQDKGQSNCINSFLNSIRQETPSPIPYNELMETSRVSIEVASALEE